MRTPTETESQAVGDFGDWNTRHDMLIFYGLDIKSLVYEIPHNCTYYAIFESFIKSHPESIKYTRYIPEETRNFFETRSSFDIPEKINNNIHIEYEHTDGIYHIISCTDIMYMAGKILPFMFVVKEPKTGAERMSDIFSFVDHIISQYGGDIAKKLFSYTLMHTATGAQWHMTKPIPRRDMATVYIDNKVKEDICNDITKFSKRREFYQSTGIPYKRCYLLHGLPGTGKTTLAKAIATHFNKNIAILQLKTAFLDDHGLMHAMHNIPKNTVILIEDLDSSFGGDIRENDDPRMMMMMNKVSFNGIIDMLDGFNSYDEQIIIITCNNTKAFNNIYMRAGRIDKTYEFGPLTANAAQQMLTRFCPDGTKEQIEKIAKAVPDGKIVPADLQTLIMENDFNLDNIGKKFINQASALKTKYQDLNTRNNDMFKAYYQNSYGYTQNNMYT